MIPYPDIDPVALTLGPLQIHWYGLTYLVGFIGGWWFGTLRAKQPHSGWKPAEISDLLFYFALGIIIGGRLGYTLFYGLQDAISNPISIIQIWKGGMSFHGGLIGALISLWIYARKTRRKTFQVYDFVAPLVPIGLGTGRIGNFINGELWGKVTEVPWGMVFPGAGNLPRHPSQLYEALLEGLVLFIILWVFTAKPRPMMSATGLALLGYGCFRVFIEFYRLPDVQLQYLAFGWLTMGQLLSLPMIIAGLLLLFFAYRKQLSN